MRRPARPDPVRLEVEGLMHLAADVHPQGVIAYVAPVVGVRAPQGSADFVCVHLLLCSLRLALSLA